MKTQTLFEHTYTNGNCVLVTNHGVTIWDNDARRWVLDASTIAEDNEFYVANEMIKGERFPFSAHTVIKSKYPKHLWLNVKTNELEIDPDIPYENLHDEELNSKWFYVGEFD